MLRYFINVKRVQLEKERNGSSRQVNGVGQGWVLRETHPSTQKYTEVQIGSGNIEVKPLTCYCDELFG